MKIRRIPPVFLLAFLIGCGGSMMTMNTPTTRQLTSIAVSPMNAIVQNGTNKQVQFSAMGSYNMAPMSAMPQVVWSIGPQSGMMGMGMMGMSTAPAGVSITASGMAQCTTFTGTVMIFATAPRDPSMPVAQMNSMSMNVSGSAQLTCP